MSPIDFGARTSPLIDGDKAFSLEELRGLTIQGTAKTVRLDDIATVEATFSRPPAR